MRQRGYTLIELLMVLAVMAVLASMAMPFVEMTAQRERERELKRALWEIRDAIDGWNKACLVGAIQVPAGALPYPPTLVALASAQPDRRPDQRGKVLRFLRSVPRDPFADAALPAEETWGLRGYKSEADAPQPGPEVYDVYSRSRGMGLNGVPLSKM